MMDFIKANGGVMAVVGLVVIFFNILMSAIAQGFAALGKSEPAFLQKVGSVGLTLSQWLTANTPTPTTAAPVVLAQPIPASTPQAARKA